MRHEQKLVRALCSKRKKTKKGKRDREFDGEERIVQKSNLIGE
jgi:hypothetical protein